MTRLDAVRALVERGFTNKQIAAELGLKSVDSVTRLRRQAGVSDNRQNRDPLDEATRARIYELINVEEWPPGEVVATLGVSFESVRKFGQYTGYPQAGKDWNKIARWCARVHPRLYRELIA